MVRDADLSREETVVPHLRSACDACLGRGNGILADLHVVADLDQVVEFHAPADDRRVGLGPVDAGVGADFHVVFDDDVAQLRNLVEAACGIGNEAEAVGADHRTRMQDAAAADHAPLVNLDTRVEDRSVADGHAVTDIDLGIDLAVGADAGSRLDNGEIAHVTIFAQCRPLRDRSPLADALFAGFCGLIHLQQFEHCGAGVFDFNQGGGHGFRRGEILVHQYDRRTGFVKVFFVFGVGQVGQGAGFALFDRGDGVHLGLFVACDLAAEKTGDHFCGKFHHSNIVIRGIFLCLFLRA